MTMANVITGNPLLLIPEQKILAGREQNQKELLLLHMA
jgi:hypothetical protein